MASSRIFVSYAYTGDERGAVIARQLVSDIRAKNIEVVTDHETLSEENFMAFLSRELPQCRYLIFVQTPVALQSSHVQAAVKQALALVAQQRMQGVLRFIAVSALNVGNQPPLVTLPAFDASMDYPRARDKLFIELGLIGMDANDSFLIPPSLLASIPPVPPGNNRPPQPSGPMAGQWPLQSSGPIPRPSGPMGGNWPPQPSGPMPRSSGSMGNSRPLQPSGPMPRPSGPVLRPSSGSVNSPGSNYSAWPRKNQPMPLPGRVWLKIQELFARPLKTSQTSIAAQPEIPFIASMGTLLEDRPLPLNTTRKMIIRWASIVGSVLVLVLATILIIVLVRNHITPGKRAPHHSKSYSINAPLSSSSPVYSGKLQAEER